MLSIVPDCDQLESNPDRVSTSRSPKINLHIVKSRAEKEPEASSTLRLAITISLHRAHQRDNHAATKQEVYSKQPAQAPPEESFIIRPLASSAHLRSLVFMSRGRRAHECEARRLELLATCGNQRPGDVQPGVSDARNASQPPPHAA
jgi:hypothetical protein